MRRWAFPRRIPTAAWAVPLYLAVYVLFDWASYIRPVAGLNITPWNPQQALAVALLVFRPKAGWLAFAGLVVAEIAVRGVPDQSLRALAAAAVVTIVFLAIARGLRRSLDLDDPLGTHRELLRFALIVTVGSLASAVLYVPILASSASREAAPLPLVAGYWVGDAVALLVDLPLLLLLMSPARRAGMREVLRSPVWWACAAVTCITLAWVFGRREEDYFKYFYLLLPPVVWASVRFGVAGAVLASLLAQVGLVMGAQIALEHDLTLFELQVLMAATAFTALLLGVAVDERARAESELRAQLRYSAAGQMAAALAHELGQPVTALQNYAEACRMLAGAAGEGAASREQLSHAIAQLASEAQRVGAVTRRLRDFFGSGAMSIQPASLPALVSDTLEAHAQIAARAGVALEPDLAELPPVPLDVIQMAVVLRNLIANAIESAANSPGATVTVRIRREPAGVMLEVVDTGPGIDAAQLRTVFEGSASAKEGGLGVGLRICRTIVEAHGGTLWARSGGHGHFGFTLPLESPPADDPRR